MVLPRGLDLPTLNFFFFIYNAFMLILGWAFVFLRVGLQLCLAIDQQIPTVTVPETLCEQSLLRTTQLGPITMISSGDLPGVRTIQLTPGHLQINNELAVLEEVGSRQPEGKAPYFQEFLFLSLITGLPLRHRASSVTQVINGISVFFFSPDSVYIMTANDGIRVFRIDDDGRSDSLGYYEVGESLLSRLWGWQFHREVTRQGWVPFMTREGPRLLEVNRDHLNLREDLYLLPKDVNKEIKPGPLVVNDEGTRLFIRVAHRHSSIGDLPLLWDITAGGEAIPLKDILNRQSVSTKNIYGYYALGNGLFLKTDKIFWLDFKTLKAVPVDLPPLEILAENGNGIRTHVSVQRNSYGYDYGYDDHESARLAALLQEYPSRSVFLFNVDTGQVHKTVQFNSVVLSVALFAERPYGLALLNNGQLVLFDVRTGAPIESLDMKWPERVTRELFNGWVRISPDDRTVLVFSQRGGRAIRILKVGSEGLNFRSGR